MDKRKGSGAAAQRAAQGSEIAVDFVTRFKLISLTRENCAGLEHPVRRQPLSYRPGLDDGRHSLGKELYSVGLQVSELLNAKLTRN